MQTITMVITNSGDGSNGILWFKGTLTSETEDKLLNYDPEYFGSGDGFQAHHYHFPDDFDFKTMGIREFDTVEEFLNQ